ncbi:ferrochelatase [Sneathiella chungangensis]|uniref:Ferrochelatase n=1 Tax=Sneathiella chungangensis TaxID=1418234 RepID=A0A845MK84_9PROT|nr:ferrochelatase [Sneathiella chungangensis]MZR24065.1 ferrochelatase [Sneathiella chungangensis]
MTKKAVVLFNLGGPDGPAAVEPFLFNLFYDPAIIRLPKPLRWLVAKMISRRRAPVAQEIYAQIGGASPILPQTEAQAAALQDLLDQEAGDDYRVFVSMRYWHPFAHDVARAVADWTPEEVILLPLYPQFSSTTTASSLEEWTRAANAAGLAAPTASLCCYPFEKGLISACTELIAPKVAEMAGQKVRVLFSAHGLPQKIVDAGDPYQWQVERMAEKIVDRLAVPELDWKVCYQSRVGPMKWLEPSTETEIERAGAEAISLIVVPIAFVSEHSETLVELDIEYAHLAREAGVPEYHRIRTVGVQADFIAGLARMITALPPGRISSESGTRICPGGFKDCLMLAS